MIAVMPRIGVVRPAPSHPVVAEADARVVRHELERRLGPLTLDLRVDGGTTGTWQPLEHVSWPTDVDAIVEADALFGDGVPPLTNLFARTVDPETADVRRRMLVHLGLIDGEPFDDAALAAVDEMVPTPTDLWLIVSSAPFVTVDDRTIRNLARPDADEAATIDAAFDALADRLRPQHAIAAGVDRTLARISAERDELLVRVDELARDLARHRAEAAATIDDLSNRAAERDLDADG